MTDKLIMTTAERDDILHALSVPEHADDGEIATAIAMLQSLPMVSGEPAAWRHDHGEENGGFEYYEEASCDKCQPLYTSPQALTPITADDVTDEMVHESCFINVFNAKQQIATVFNLVNKHRSEEK